MSYNPVIRGLNASWKFIARGYAKITAIGGEKVPFCRVWTEPYIPIAVETKPFICQKVSTDNYINMKVRTA